MRNISLKPDVLLKAAAAAVALFPLAASGEPNDGGDSRTGSEQAAAQTDSATGPAEEIVTLTQDDLYEQGISVDSLLGGNVTDDSGNQVGEIEDLVLGADDNNVTGLIVAAGGFLGVGENHLLFPFEKASIEGSDRIRANISSSTAKELSLFKDIEGQPLEGGRSRVSEVIGSLAYSDGEPYGRVDDLVIDRSGNILAVVVQADVMYDDEAYYAWPFAGYYNDADDIYDVPEEERHRFGEEPFDPGALEGAQRSGNSSGNSPSSS